MSIDIEQEEEEEERIRNNKCIELPYSCCWEGRYKDFIDYVYIALNIYRKKYYEESKEWKSSKKYYIALI